MKSLGFAGEIKDYSGDYLHINDSNFGGLKTNHYMTEEVEQTVEKTAEGSWRKTVKIKYFNPAPYDAWLSGNYKDFVRIYVPKGSRLVSTEGIAQIWTSAGTWASTIQNPEGWEEFGKTVFGGYFTLRPQKEQTVTFVYDLPVGIMSEEEYRLLVQKQPGTNIGLVRVNFGAKMNSFDLKTDRETVISGE